MKVWCAVYMFGGIIYDMEVFSTKEAASKYFLNIINENGGIDACNPDFYEDGSGSTEAFYWFNGDDEIVIWKCEVEG